MPTSAPAPIRCTMSDGTPITSAFLPYTTRWADALALAQNTPSLNVNGPVGQLQSIRRDTAAAPWPQCARAAADLLLVGMDSQISGLLGFMAATGPGATRNIPDVGNVTYSQLAAVVGQQRADAIFYADSYAAIDAGRVYFGQFATELAYAAGEIPRPDH